MKLSHTIVTIVTLIFTQCVAAQYMGMFNSSNAAGVNIAGTIAVNSAIDKQAKNAAKNKRRAVSDVATPSFTYRPSPSVSRQVKDQFRIAVQRADPAKAEHIASVLATQDVVADFARDMAPFGLKATNVADTMTAFWITMWMIANEAPVPGKQHVTGVQQQVASNMLVNAMAANASEAQRQELAEGLIYETMFALGQRADAERRGDIGRLRVLADDAQRNVQRMIGVDLRSLRLTTGNGFAG